MSVFIILSKSWRVYMSVLKTTNTPSGNEAVKLQNLGNVYIFCKKKIKRLKDWIVSVSTKVSFQRLTLLLISLILWISHLLSFNVNQ